MSSQDQIQLSGTPLQTLKDRVSPAFRRLPPNAGILLVLVGTALIFELLGWLFVGKSFLINVKRLEIIILQVAIIGIIAVGVTQVIILAGIDLSSGAVAAMAAMASASLAQTTTPYGTPLYPGLIDLPVIIPLFAGLGVGILAGFLNGSITAVAGIPPFIPTLGMLVAGRGLAVFYTEGKPIFGLSSSFTSIGSGLWPVAIFGLVVIVFHILLSRTLYGRRTYAIGSNEEAARVAGVNVTRHKILVYTIAGMLSGLAGVVMCARATMGQSGMGLMYELDAISAAVIGGTSLFGGRGRILGTVIGVCILGTMTSGFTFLRIDFYYQEIAKGLIIVVAVIADQYIYRRRV